LNERSKTARRMEKELFAGLHFDRRRFKKEIELFNVS
jgi:hypothetical protein